MAEKRECRKRETAAGKQAVKTVSGKRPAPHKGKLSKTRKAEAGSAKKENARAASRGNSGTASVKEKRSRSSSAQTHRKKAAHKRIKSTDVGRKSAIKPSNRAGMDADLFMERRERPRKRASGKKPPRGAGTAFGVLNACLLIGIALLAALGIRQHAAYAEFLRMREVVDQQTFYEGTTIEGVDVSSMTLAVAMNHWGERVEPRYANRAVTLDNGQTVTSGQLGYSSDYASVLSAAWSAGRSGTLEQRYQSASYRSQNPVAYAITRADYDEGVLDQFVNSVAEQTDAPAVEAKIESFDVENYEFVFKEAEPGRKLDIAALKRDIARAISAGGGSVALAVEALKPESSTAELMSQYGLIDYAITNASSSSKARLNNIKLAMSMLNGVCVAPGETFSFNAAVGERTTERGFKKATAYSGGDVTEQVGGGICQVSTTLFNAAVKADMEIVERHSHSLTVSYVDKGKDATVNWDSQDLRFKNTSPDNIYICCYLTDDKRVRFGIFGRLLPNGEKITLDAVTTESMKFETQYIKTPLLPPGQTYILQEGRNGYKAEAYKVRWDAQGNQLSRELLCKSFYKQKDQIVQYGV